jgi:hypothetical protein
MFSRSDGPTALRADLVRALAFSSQQCDLPLAEGDAGEPAVAALAGVWNGRKGFVALVVYRIESQQVERYVFADPIDSEVGLGHAIDEGLAFAESFGFGMDAADFVSLPVEQQEQRLRVWNKLRKPRQGIASPAPAPVQPLAPQPAFEHAGDIDPTATPTPVPCADPLPAAAAAEAEPAVVAEAPAGRAVLGRIELVRRGVEEARPDPLIRLLSYL